jgi:O-antigen/teichoic acid export membrane protein
MIQLQLLRGFTRIGQKPLTDLLSNRQNFMTNSRFLRNVSANTLQIIINQFFGLAIFYALSKGVDKVLFGQINWALAVLLTCFGILSFGMDQVMVRKIAAGYNKQALFSAYLHHVLISGLLIYGLLLVLYLIFPSFFSKNIFLLFIGIGKLAIYFSTPFKQLSAALEKFYDLFVMSVVSNIIRGTVLVFLLIFHAISIPSILITFILGDLLELTCSYFITRKLLLYPDSFKWNKRKQISLMRESLPQTGVVFFTAVMSRLDWILVGLLISSAKLAEYSFAYKIFEVSTLPLLILAPLMLPLFTRVAKQDANLSGFYFLLEWQVMIASLIGLILNMCWIPLVDFISDHKYGAVNSTTVFILSLSMPFLYFSNYLWTIHFARGNMRLIFRIMAISLVINIAGCGILIPVFKNEGAALAYLMTVSVQALMYLFNKPYAIEKFEWRLLAAPLTALVSGFVSSRSASGLIIQLPLAVGLFMLVIYLLKSIRFTDWQQLQALYK